MCIRDRYCSVIFISTSNSICQIYTDMCLLTNTYIPGYPGNLRRSFSTSEEAKLECSKGTFYTIFFIVYPEFHVNAFEIQLKNKLCILIFCCKFNYRKICVFFQERFVPELPLNQSTGNGLLDREEIYSQALPGIKPC